MVGWFSPVLCVWPQAQTGASLTSHSAQSRSVRFTLDAAVERTVGVCDVERSAQPRNSGPIEEGVGRRATRRNSRGTAEGGGEDRNRNELQQQNEANQAEDIRFRMQRHNLNAFVDVLYFLLKSHTKTIKRIINAERDGREPYSFAVKNKIVQQKYHPLTQSQDF